VAPRHDSRLRNIVPSIGFLYLESGGPQQIRSGALRLSISSYVENLVGNSASEPLGHIYYQPLVGCQVQAPNIGGTTLLSPKPHAVGEVSTAPE